MKLQSEFSREFLKTIFARLPPLASVARTPRTPLATPLCGAKPDVSPPECSNSRLSPADKLHFSPYALTQSCHRNSFLWIKPTKINRHGNIHWGIEKQISD